MGNQISHSQPTNGLAFNYLQKGHDWTEEGVEFEQSPIDIIPDSAPCCNNVMKMEFFLSDHTLTGLQVQDSGNSLSVSGPFSKLKATDVDGSTYEYEAAQFHFHAPAEHTINGGLYDLELHIVHKMTAESAKNATTQRDLAVVAVFFEVGSDAITAPNTFIEALNLGNIGSNINLNMHELLSNDLVNMMTYYAYKGSLTTPPCNEKVNWYVFEKPLKIAKSQMDHFNLRWKDNINYAGGHGNNRLVQPLNGRVVTKSNNCCIFGTSQEALRKVLQSNYVAPTIKLNIQRDIMFDNSPMRSQHSKGDIQGFIGTPTYKNSKNNISFSGTPTHGTIKENNYEFFGTPTYQTTRGKYPGFSNTPTHKTTKESAFASGGMTFQKNKTRFGIPIKI
jgi:carbonic anhydrase